MLYSFKHTVHGVYLSALVLRNYNQPILILRNYLSPDLILRNYLSQSCLPDESPQSHKKSSLPLAQPYLLRVKGAGS